MKNFRRRTDEGFAAFARLIYRNRIKTLVLMALLVGGLLSQLPKLTADNSINVWFHEDDPDLIAYDAFQEQFGRDTDVIVAITPPEVFDTGFLRKLVAFHEALEAEVPYLKEVTSLVNVRDTRGEGDELVVEDLLEELPETPEAMAELRTRVLSSELYPNYLVSEDGKLTTIFLETLAFSPEGREDELLEGFEDEAGAEPADGAGRRVALTEAENSEVVRAVEKVAARFHGPDFPIQLTGRPVIRDSFNTAIARDMRTFMSLTFAAFTVLLLLLFRRFSGALLPLMVVMISMLSTLSLMAIFGAPFTSVTSILPSFIMSVGVGSSVHVLAIFYRRYKQMGDKEEAIAHTFGHSGLPILMTSLTTAAGLLSFANVGLAPAADLGKYGAMGVMLILVFTFMLMPALISILPLRQTARFAGKRYGHGMDRLLTSIADFATKRAGLVVVVGALIVVVAGAGLFQQGFGQNLIKWFPPGSDVRNGVELMDREMRGSSGIEVVIDLGQENGLYEPAVMNNIEALTRYLEEYRDESGALLVGNTTSIVDVLQEIHQALNENRHEFYAIPKDRELIAQELLLFENSGSDDLEKLVDTQFSMARLSARVINKDAAEYVAFVADIEKQADRLFGGGASVTVTGILKLFTQTVDLLMKSLTESYLIAGVVITVLMMLMLGSFRIGLLSMIPNLAPIVVTMGVMGWIGIKLDMVNILLGTVAIGLAVDDTIHFFHNFRRYYTETGNAGEAVRRTMLSTGRAMLFTTLVLITGFWLFMFASLINLIHFGFLIGVTLIIALLADIFLAPAMMELITRTERGRRIMAKWGRAEAAA